MSTEKNKEKGEEPQLKSVSAEATTPLQPDRAPMPVHCNFCRVMATPEEFLLDFVMNPNFFGQISHEAVGIQSRIVMSPEAAKRLMAMLASTVNGFEEKFGEIKMDPRAKLQEPLLS